MKVILSAAMSLDGFIDDIGATPLRLSCEDDRAAIDAIRAESDAILVGAETVRSDDPSLASRDDAAVLRRRRLGKPAHPLKVTLTRTGHLDPGSRFFTAGDGPKVVFRAGGSSNDLEARLAGLAEVVRTGGDDVPVSSVIDALSRRGVDQLLVEGGTRVLTLFLQSGRVSIMRLAVAPLILGRRGKARLLDPADFSMVGHGDIRLASVEKLGTMAVLWFDIATTRT